MAEPVMLHSLAAWLGGHAIEGSMNSVMLKLTNRDNPDNRLGTPAGPGDSMTAVYPGILDVDATLKGYYSSGSAAAGDPENIIHPRIIGDPSAWPLTLCPPDAPASVPGSDGNIAYTVESAQLSYTVGAQHGDSLPYECASKPRSGARIARQTVMLPKALRTVTATGAGQQLGQLAATQMLVSTVHLFAITGGSLTVTVESDDNAPFSSAVTRITHAAMTTAPNRESRQLVGPIATDDRWRVVATYTPGTNFTVAVLLGIVPLF